MRSKVKSVRRVEKTSRGTVVEVIVDLGPDEEIAEFHVSSSALHFTARDLTRPRYLVAGTEVWMRRDYGKIAGKNDFKATVVDENRIEVVLRMDSGNFLVEDRPTVRGASVPGVAKIISGLNAFLTVSPDDRYAEFGMGRSQLLVVVVAWPEWRLSDRRQKRGMLDHLLSHFVYDGGKWHIVYPEYGEFPQVLLRNGPWRRDFERGRQRQFFEFAGSQLSVFDEIERLESSDSGDTASGQSMDSLMGEIIQGAAEQMREMYADEIERGEMDITTSLDERGGAG